MAMELARRYIAPINISSAFTTQIDFIELLAGTGKPLTILGWEFGQTSEVGDAQEEWLVFAMKRVTGSPTSGTGGGTPTIQTLAPNDTASGATLETGNTTKLTGGTSAELGRLPWNVRQSCMYRPVPEERVVVDAATRFVLELVTTPADSIASVQGWITIAELV